LKKFVLIVLFFSGLIYRAQTPTGPNSTQTNSQAKGISKNHTQNLVTTLSHDTCLNRMFSIVFYVILDSTQTPGQASPAAISQFIDTLNKRFQKICVRFGNCSTVYIPNHGYAEWYRPTTDSIITSQWYTEKTINIYLVDSIYQNVPEEPFGYTYGLPSNTNLPTKDVIVLEKWHLLANNCGLALHQIGHYFGLVHTHGEINPSLPTTPPTPTNVASKEFVDRSNCELHGDGLCDTEADPSVFGTMDGKGQYYLAPRDNYMSGYSSSCRFSQQQYNRMAYFMITARRYLH
jgi:hypothetical protein